MAEMAGVAVGVEMVIMTMTKSVEAFTGLLCEVTEMNKKKKLPKQRMEV